MLWCDKNVIKQYGNNTATPTSHQISYTTHSGFALLIEKLVGVCYLSPAISLLIDNSHVLVC